MYTISIFYGGEMYNLNINEFCKVYVEGINKDKERFINYIKKESEYLNIIYDNLRNLRYKTEDDLIEDYTSVIIMIKGKMDKNNIIIENSKKESLEEYFRFIIEKICPEINENLKPDDLSLFLKAASHYFNNEREELLKIYDKVKQIKKSNDVKVNNEIITLLINEMEGQYQEDIKKDEEKLERLKLASSNLDLLNDIIF